MSCTAQFLVDLCASRKYAGLSDRNLLECIAQGSGSVYNGGNVVVGNRSIYTASYADPNVAGLIPDDPTKAASFYQDPAIALYNRWNWSVANQTWFRLSPNAFAYEPATAIITWTDSGGSKNGNLAYFKANADIPTVSLVNLQSQTIISLNDLLALPTLTHLYIYDNYLTTLDISGCPLLSFIDCSYNTLDGDSISNILCVLDSNGLNSGHAELQYNSGSPNPSGAACYANLQAKGWYVFAN